MNMTKKLNENTSKVVKVSSKKSKQDDEEKAILLKALRNIDEDIDMFVIAKNILVAELDYYNPDAEKLKRLICDIESAEEDLGNRLKELDEAREIFLKRRATHKISNAVDEL